MQSKYKRIEVALEEYNKLLKELDKMYKPLEKMIDKGVSTKDPKYKKMSLEYEAEYAKTNDFRKNVLAKVVFEELKKEKPLIKNIRTNELVEWDKLFDDNFEVVKKNDRNLLILSGLFINSGPYRLNN